MKNHVGLDARRKEVVAVIREERAKEAITCLKLAGHDPKSGLLLDLGCGGGYLTNYFLKLGIEAVGVEVAKSWMSCLKNAKKDVPSGSFINADGVNLPFKEECFHTVILNDVLEHVPYNLAHPMLNEVRRTLKASGKLYISVMNRYVLRETHTGIPFLTWLPRPCWDAVCRLAKWKRPTYSCYPYTAKGLRKLCRMAGFTCRDYTWFYAWNKVSNVQRIRYPILRKMVETVKKLKLSKLAYVIAEKVSVMLFICEK